MSGKGLSIGFGQKPRGVIASPGRFGVYGTLNNGTSYNPSNVLPAGFLAEGHYLPSIQPMVLVYPRPDGETSPNARHHWAFLDGVNPMMYDIPIDLIGGAWPHVPVIMNAPPGMTIVMPNYAAGPPYPSPRLQWTPNASWSGQVWIRWYSQEYPGNPNEYIDQQFLLQTSSDISQGGQFIFVNADTGVSTNNGSYNSPVDDMPTVFGATSWGQAAPLIGGKSVGGKICVLQGATSEYTLPLYTDGSTAQPHFQTQVLTKPIALIGVPGQTLPKFSVASAGGVSMGNDTHASDWFTSRLNPDGYNTLAQNFIQMSVGGSGDNRITFDKITWSNSGWGNVSVFEASISGSVMTVTAFTSGAPLVEGQSVNINGVVNGHQALISSFGTGTGGLGTYNLDSSFTIPTARTMNAFFGAGNCVAFEAVANTTLRQYIYVNDCTETNRQPGQPANNGAGVDWFSCQYSLIQGWDFNQPNWVGDGGSFFKIDIPNSEIRGCRMICQFCVQAFSFEYFVTGDGPSFTLSDSKHNILVGGQYLACPGNATPGYGTLRIGRCNILNKSNNPSGMLRSSPQPNGPYSFVGIVAQGPVTTLPSTPYLTVTDVLIGTSGLLLSDGTMDPSNPNYSSNLGVIGALVK